MMAVKLRKEENHNFDNNYKNENKLNFNLRKMMKNINKISILVIILLGMSSTLVSCQSTSELDHSIDLDENYRLYWRVIEQDIVFEIQVRTAGYVGFGFSRDGTIYGADLVIGWIDSGHPYFQVSLSILKFSLKIQKCAYYS